MFAGSDAPHNPLERAVVRALDAASLSPEGREELRQSLHRVLQNAPAFGDPVKDMNLRAVLAAQFDAAFAAAGSGETHSAAAKG